MPADVTPAPTALLRHGAVVVAVTAATGAAAGAAATAPMSAVVLLARRAGLLGRLPPAAITEAAEHAAGLRPPPVVHRVLAVLAHTGFGAAAGVPFALLGRALPAGVPRAPLGAAYGVGVWASAYLGWVPAVGVLPPAHRDRPDRQASVLLAHVVYGAVLGGLFGRWQRTSAGLGPERGPAADSLGADGRDEESG